MAHEFEICANHGTENKEGVLNNFKPQGFTGYCVGALLAGVLLSLIQLVMGAAILASLLFIALSDALEFVLIRYICSAIICRFILMFEIAGLKGPRRKHEVGQEQGLLGSADGIEMNNSTE